MNIEKIWNKYRIDWIEEKKEKETYKNQIISWTFCMVSLFDVVVVFVVIFLFLFLEKICLQIIKISRKTSVLLVVAL